ncbi:hypothetical protein G6F63_013897 [Rhizopus arrhizus]|nr:hypothetical protein G6F63_013897 [Rhizopus arrhizus]
MVVFQPALRGCPRPRIRAFQCGALLRCAAVCAPVRSALRDGCGRAARALQQCPSRRQCAPCHHQAQQRLIRLLGHSPLSTARNNGALGRLRMYVSGFAGGVCRPAAGTT